MQPIQQLDLESEYRSIFALSEFAFQYELTPEALENKKKDANRHIIWGIKDNEQIAAKLHLIPLSVYIGGKEMNMGGISGVATWPEYRRNGMVKQLLHHSLQYMKENGQTVSYLYPFSYAYYRKYGWELAFGEKAYSIPMERFSKPIEASGYVRRIQTDIPLLQSIYTTYAKNFNGMLARDEKWWKDRVLKDEKMHIAVSYSENDVPNGYIIFKVKEDVLHVKDMAYSSLNGRKLLLRFIANHDSMAKTVKMTVPDNDDLPLLLDEPRFEQKQKPYFMARIVDIHAFLRKFSFVEANERVTLHVEDTFFPENTGTYELRQHATGTNVTFINDNQAPFNARGGIHCSVQKLTAMCMGYARSVDLFASGLIQGKPDDIEKLDRMIPNEQPYFADFF